MNKKISTPLAISIIVVLAVIVVGSIIVYQYLKGELAKNETGDWKVYKINDYYCNFEIHYPPYLAVKEMSFAEDAATEVFFEGTDNTEFFVHCGGLTPSEDFNGKIPTSEQAAIGLVKNEKERVSGLKEENIVINNFAATKLSNFQNDSYIFEIPLSVNKQFYVITARADLAQKNKYSPIFEEMLSTLKFTK